MAVTCADCWAVNQVGYGPCAKHSTPEQLAAFQRKLTTLANMEHPMLRLVKRR